MPKSVATAADVRRAATMGDARRVAAIGALATMGVCVFLGYAVFLATRPPGQ